ncbi:unnamed protein product [Ectocarpus sp. 6 AP-2014]
MGRSRRSAPARRPAPRSAPPARAPPAQPPAQQQSGGGGMLSGMASTMAQGFAFGTGSSIAHRAVGAVMGGGGSSAPVEQAQEQAPQAYQQPPVDPCDVDKQNFGQCLQNNNNDVTACQFVFEALQTCQIEAKKSYN